MFVLVLRAVGLSCRITMSLHPIPLKPLTEKQKETKKKKVEAELEKVWLKSFLLRKSYGVNKFLFRDYIL